MTVLVVSLYFNLKLLAPLALQSFFESSNRATVLPRGVAQGFYPGRFGSGSPKIAGSVFFALGHIVSFCVGPGQRVVFFSFL